MKKIFENVINRGMYDLTGLLKKIDSYHIEGKLNDEDRDELYALARGGAKIENTVDILAKLTDHEYRIRALETSGAAENAPNDVPEYVVGKWYNNGDKVIFEGVTYVCSNVPEGSVCTWSPSEYPAYWTEYASE